MILLTAGLSHRTAPVELRERVAFDQERLVVALDQLVARYGCEAVILSTCNRVEMYLARAETAAALDAALIAEFLGEFHQLSGDHLLSHLYEFHHADAVRHLFRVVASLDSLIVGEGQIAGQVKRAYEIAHAHGTAGPVLHFLFQQAFQVAKRVRTETGIARGHVSVSSAAVDYVRQVFEHFDDKTILVIGAGKMGELTLQHLRQLQPRRIWVANRSPEKAEAVAAGCGGTAIIWDDLDGALAKADIILSTTGAAEPIVSLERYEKTQARRKSGNPVVILDIAVPRDFDPRIHDGDRTCLFNIDDLKRIREQTLSDRKRHIAPAEAIVEEEQHRFLKDWARRQHAPVIARLTREFEAKRQAIVEQLFNRLNGRLTGDDRAYIEGAFRLLQNQFLHGPISVLAEEPHESGGHTLLDALRKLFRLPE
jgi:glutamyl-tRNA reductase